MESSIRPVDIYLASQAKKAAFALLAISVRLNHPSVTVMLRLYDALITPIMSYSCGFNNNFKDQKSQGGLLVIHTNSKGLMHKNSY